MIHAMEVKDTSLGFIILKHKFNDELLLAHNIPKEQKLFLQHVKIVRKQVCVVHEFVFSFVLISLGTCFKFHQSSLRVDGSLSTFNTFEIY